MPARASGERQARHGGRAHARAGSQRGCGDRIGRVLLHETVPSVPRAGTSNQRYGTRQIHATALGCTPCPDSRSTLRGPHALRRAADHIERAWASFDAARDGQPGLGEELGRVLAGGLPEASTPVLTALDDAAQVLDESLAPARPRYFAFVGSSGLEVAVLADALASAHDVNLATHAGVADLVERQALDWVGRFVGYPSTGGAFTSGGMISNLTALGGGPRVRAARRPRDGPPRTAGGAVLLGRGALQRAAGGGGARSRRRQRAVDRDRRPAADDRARRRRRPSTRMSPPASRRSRWWRRRARR